MKHIIKNLSKWATIWFGFSLMIWIIWISYAALSSLTATDWESLTAEKWNNLVQHSVPTWAIMAFNWTTCPDWWTAADWSWDEKDTDWNLTTLDLRNEFIRWTSDTRTLRNKEDATAVQLYDWAYPWSGAKRAIDYDSSFKPSWSSTEYQSRSTGNLWTAQNYARVRPQNVALLFCIKN